MRDTAGCLELETRPTFVTGVVVVVVVVDEKKREEDDGGRMTERERKVRTRAKACVGPKAKAPSHRKLELRTGKPDQGKRLGRRAEQKGSVDGNKGG